MKKQYRVNVPAVIAFDVVAESAEQAKRIAAAATYTPVEPIRPEEWREWDSAEIPANFCIWAATYDTDGTINKLDGDLSGCAVDILDRTSVSDDEAFAVESAVKSIAQSLGNEAELEAALKS